MKYKIVYIYIGIIALLIPKVVIAQNEDVQIIDKSIAESYNNDYYIFHFKNKETRINPLYRDLFTNKNICLLYMPYGAYPWEDFYAKKKFSFIQENDTMTVCIFLYPYCNYYLKDLEFKKGTYFLNIRQYDYTELEKLRGCNIETPEYLQNILFKDYNEDVYNPSIKRQDTYFKDLKFIVIDFTDTLNVKLEPIDEEKFWDNHYLQKNQNDK